MYNVDLMKEKENNEFLTLLNETYKLNHLNELIWNDRPVSHFKNIAGYNIWNSKYSDKSPGTKMISGYCSLTFSVVGKKYTVLYHRAVFALAYGRWPSHIVDHLDGDPGNNKLENLVESNATDNNRNLSLRSKTKWGILGVNWDRHNNKWRAAGGDHGKFIHLGRTFDFFEACCLRKSWELKEGYSINHGKERVK